MPIVAAPQLEISALYSSDPAHAKVLDHIEASFHLSKQDFGYEIRIRGALSEIWLSLFELSQQVVEEKEEDDTGAFYDLDTCMEEVSAVR